MIKFRVLFVLALFPLLTAADCSRRFEHDDLVSNDNTPLTLFTTTHASSLPADGLSTLELRAKIPSEAVKANRVIVFKSNGGTLVGGTNNSLDVPPDPSGTATALLRSSRTIGPVTVSAQVKDGTALQAAFAQLALEFVEPDGSSILRFVRAPATAPADGATATRFAVEVSESLPGDQRTVTFKTTAGSFTSVGQTAMTTAIAGVDRIASVLLYSAKAEGLALVTADVGNFHAETPLRFERARAQTILVEVEKFTLPKNSHMKVTARLLRDVGVPTAGTIVTFKAFDVDNKSFGVFKNVQRSQDDGSATAELFPDGGGMPGRARIEVTAEGSRAKGTADFELTAAGNG